MNAPRPELVNCPHCGVKNPAIEEDCRECGRRLTVFIGPPAKIRRIGLGPLMLLIAEIAVCLAVLREVPVLGILMLLILMPAQVRTLVAVARRKADERPMRWEEALATFFTSMCLMLLISVAGLIAFGTTCFVGFWGGAGLRSLWPSAGNKGMEWGFLLGVTSGALAAACAMILLLRRFWDTKD